MVETNALIEFHVTIITHYHVSLLLYLSLLLLGIFHTLAWHDGLRDDPLLQFDHGGNIIDSE